MATKTEESIQSLREEIVALKEQVRELRVEAGSLRLLNSEFAVVKHQLAEMQKARDVWGQRGWTVMTVVLSTILSAGSAVLVAVLNSYLNTKR